MFCARLACLALAALAVLPAAARGAQPPAFQGTYINSFAAGRTHDGRQVAVLAGSHLNFPYDGARYAQVAVIVGRSEPIVITAKPALRGLDLRPGDRSFEVSYARPGLTLKLSFAAVRHPDRVEGDPTKLGNLLTTLGLPSSYAPGLVYTPYELTRIRSATLIVRGRRVRVTSLHGQAEAGHLTSPSGRPFEPGYEYLAAPTLGGRSPYTYVDFLVYSLHSGADGALDSYYRGYFSEDFTLERGTLSSGDPHGVARTFDNRRIPRGVRNQGQWALDLGPGVLYRKIVRLRDRRGRPLLALSETIVERHGPLDRRRPVIGRARARRSCPVSHSGHSNSRVKISFRLSKAALVYVAAHALRLIQDDRAGSNVLRLPVRAFAGRRHRVVLRATDEVGNRSRPVTLRLRRSQLRCAR